MHRVNRIKRVLSLEPTKGKNMNVNSLFKKYIVSKRDNFVMPISKDNRFLLQIVNTVPFNQ